LQQNRTTELTINLCKAFDVTKILMEVIVEPATDESCWEIVATTRLGSEKKCPSEEY